MPISDPLARADSYRVCPDCGAECAHLDQSTPERPCWGIVTITWTGEDYFHEGDHIHACKGHECIWINNSQSTTYTSERINPC